MSSYSEFAQIIGNLELAKGQAQAGGAQRSGAIWGSALANLGGLVASIPQQRAQQREQQMREQEQQQRAQLTQMAVEDKQRSRTAEDTINRVWATAYKPDGSIDEDTIRTGLAQSGMGSQWPALKEMFDKTRAASAQAVEAQSKAAKAQLEHGEEVARHIEALPESEQGAALIMVLGDPEQQAAIGRSNAVAIASKLLDPQNPDAPPSPERTKAVLAMMHPPDKLKPLPPTAIETTNAAGEPVRKFVTPEAGAEYPLPPAKPTTEANPTEASLALKAAGGDKTAVSALAVLRAQHQTLTPQAEKHPGDPSLAQAVLKNPALFGRLSQATVERLSPVLAASGFVFPPSASAGGQQGLQNARAQSATKLLERLQVVYNKMQSGEGPGQIVRGLAALTGGRINLNNAATEYQKLRKATAVALAVAIQGSRPSDADADAMASLLPDFTTPKSVADDLFMSSLNQLKDTSEAMSGTAQPSQASGSGRFEILSVK